MRRILLVLSVAALMAVMMVAMAAPAFADKGGGHCLTNSTDLPTPSGCTEPHKNTAVFTYRGPEEAPGSTAQGGKPGYSGTGACHGPHC